MLRTNGYHRLKKDACFHTQQQDIQIDILPAKPTVQVILNTYSQQGSK